jgi:1,4-alpha-glucan branching enzyme
MPGDSWQKFANLRLLLAYQMSYPGKKLNFMGNEIAQGKEWWEGTELEWWLLERQQHQGVKNMVRDLNHLYRQLPALHSQDFQPEGFNWIDCHDADQSILSYLRWGKDGSFVIVAINFTPVPRTGYRIGVPRWGRYREIFNSDSELYGGSNTGNGQGLDAESHAWMCQPQSIVLTLPPLGVTILQVE